ncbi:NAD(P)H-dependent oxidoreductase [Streptomyces sp. A3M-1-3]|uniref:flavodoxin family protein n=1 Tax=Streptomyces sp. A3M-1-3 TaxID=2962044 RepID=UPI0020B66FA6|nr:NAD(P)H-dependent oxidoreductase [Streptomyces sp. A3M-1-3]MCP3822361.1 NAD(P)H-dependent oxidoreductase [Streptomyces sp. A3M-1-3]
MARKFLFLLGSARTGGNTEALARLAAEQLPPGTEQRWIRLADHPLPDFEDLRHTGDGSYPTLHGNAALLLDATLEATDLVIASPLYWYSVSTSTKRYLDHWSGWMRVPGIEFRPRMAGRNLWGVSVLAGADQSAAEPLAGTLRQTAAYMDMNWGGVLFGTGSKPGDLHADAGASARAKIFFNQDPVTARA